MKPIVIILASLAITLVPYETAWAYSHANRYGGSTSHTYGEGTSHTNYYSGSTSHSAYGGTTHTNAYGGTTSGAYGYGAVHTTPYGTTSYASAYHPPTAYYGYHPPTTVGYYGSGCYNCGYGAAAAVGVATGVAVGAAAAANANAAAANANAAAANASLVAYEMGGVYGALPPGCASPNVQGQTYYLCGNTWFSPSYGANGVYYRVVPAP